MSNRKMTRKKSESKWTRRLCAEMEAQGAFVLPVVGNMMQRNGVPDRFVAFKLGEGQQFSGWIEFKSTITKLRPLQIAVMNELRSRGVNVFVVRLGNGTVQPTVNDIYDVPMMHFDDTGYGLMVALLHCL